jgi:hypothetical protein
MQAAGSSAGMAGVQVSLVFERGRGHKNPHAVDDGGRCSVRAHNSASRAPLPSMRGDALSSSAHVPRESR